MLWTSLSPAWQAALEQAWEAGRAGSIPIGAVITTAAGEVIARGRNHIFDPAPSGRIGLCSLAHAEINALLDFNAKIHNPHTVILHTSMEPCPQCLGSIYMAGIRTVRYAARDPYAGSTNLLGATPYLSRKPVRAYPPEDPRLETMLAALVLGFDLKRSDESHYQSILEPPFLEVLPRAVRLSRWLNEDSRLAQAWQQYACAQEFFDWLAGAL